jgi:hypothetical protein
MTGGELLPDDREEELGNEVGCVGAQPGHGIADLGIGEPLDELVGVLGQVDARNRPEGRDGFLRHVVEQELHEERVRGDLMREPVSHQAARIAQSPDDWR